MLLVLFSATTDKRSAWRSSPLLTVNECIGSSVTIVQRSFDLWPFRSPLLIMWLNKRVDELAIVFLNGRPSGQVAPAWKSRETRTLCAFCPLAPWNSVSLTFPNGGPTFCASLVLNGSVLVPRCCENNTLALGVATSEVFTLIERTCCLCLWSWGAAFGHPAGLSYRMRPKEKTAFHFHRAWNLSPISTLQMFYLIFWH